MPGCCVVECKNRSEKGFRLFRLPTGNKNSERRLEWLRLIGKTTLPERAVICEAHFDEDQFESKREDGRKLLRPYAKPTLLEKDKVEHKEQFTNTVNDTVLILQDNSLMENVEPYNKDENTNANGCNNAPSCSNINSEDVQINKKAKRTDNRNALMYKKYARHIKRLNLALKRMKKQYSIYKKKLQTKNRNMKKIFNKDQQNFITTGTRRGLSWSGDTINKALRLYISCGQEGYEELRKQSLPYPSIRTLQYRIQNLKFKPGILEDIFHLLQSRIQTFKPQEKHAVLLIDEMSIKPGLQYDNSICEILGRPTMKLSGGADSFNKLATHALVFMLCGTSTKWKQTIGYEYTANSFCPQEMVKKIMTIIEKAYTIGLTIKVVLSDMGAQNRSWWKLLNITAGKFSKIQNCIQHPCNNEDKLFITADSVHVFKNVACSLIAGNTFCLAETLVKKYNLPYNKISITPIRNVYALDQKDTLKLCPHLHKKAIDPTHFDKMNVALHVGLLNNNVAAAILYHIDKKNIDHKHKTTAWFLSTIYKWFKIMTSRNEKLALSHNNETIYTETIMFLQEFIEIVNGIMVGNGTWKPFQSGLILCTQTALDIQTEYLDKQNFKYLLLGRFTQDALENLFSSIRSRNSVPNAREFKQALRLISLSQFQIIANRSNYSTIDTNHLIQYCKEIKQLDRTNVSGDVQCLQSIENEIWNEEQYTSLTEKGTTLSDSVHSALYHLTGALISKLRKNFKHCAECFDKLITTNDVNNNNISLYTTLREFKQSVLCFPSMDIYNTICKCELLFRKHETQILANKLSPIKFVNMCLETYPMSIPQCHNIAYKLFKMFTIARIHFVLKNSDSIAHAVTNSSRCNEKFSY